MVIILLTNDDGYLSYGLRSLAKKLKEHYKVTVVCPDRPRSAAGFSLTLDKPLRIIEKSYDNIPYYLVNGTTGDCVTLGIFHILFKRPDIIVSGINIGENVSLLEFFMSGTLAGAIAAAIYGIPGIAFSKVVPNKDVLTVEEVMEDYDTASDIAVKIIKFLLENGFPGDIDLLSVNFPDKITRETSIKITYPARLSLSIKIYVREDPRGTPYYWVWGKKYGSFPNGSDGYEVLVNKNISITPISLDGLVSRDGLKKLSDLEEYLVNELDRVI